MRRGAKGFELCPHTCISAGCINESTKTPLWRKEGNSCSRHARSLHLHRGCGPTCPANHVFSEEAKGAIGVSATAEQLQEYIPRIRERARLPDDLLAYVLDLAEADLPRLYGGQPTSDVDMEATTARLEPPVVTVDKDGDTEMVENEREGDATIHDPHLGLQVHSRERSVASSMSDYSQIPNPFISQQPVGSDGVVPRCFHLLYVPDPSRECETLASARADLAYTTRTILNDSYTDLKNMVPNHIFFMRINVNDVDYRVGMTKVRISEWVSLCQSMLLLSVPHEASAMDSI